MNNKIKKTLVIGGSIKPERYSNKAIRLLRRYDHPVMAIGLREGKVKDVDIQTGRPDFRDIHTVTLYVGPRNQPPFYDYLLKLQPERIIFNPGTENPDFEQMAIKKGIQTVNHCTLVMLNEGLF
jgi:predicted CoA-binding protein